MSLVPPFRGTLSLVLLVAMPVLAQAPRYHDRTTADITPADLRARLFALAHDSMMGREPGQEGNYKASAYVAAEFKRLGLEPAGDSGTYFQVVPFQRRTADRRESLIVGSNPAVLGVDYAPVPINARARAVDGVVTVYGGLISDSTRWIDEAAARGKVVVFSVIPPEQRTTATRNAPVGRALRSSRFHDAALVMVAELDAAGSQAAAQMLSGNLVIDTTWSDQLPPAAYITNALGARIFGAPLSSLTPGATGTPLKGNVRVGLFPLQYAARNVVAVLRGTDPALRGEYVSLTAHNDHVGFDHAPVDHDSLRAFNRVVRPMGADSPRHEPSPDEARRILVILDSLRAVRPPRADSIRNGADDDGTGTVALLEIAERLSAGEHPHRSVLFVSHTAEEFGLLGSRWFTDHATVPLDSIVGELDMDMIGRGWATDLPEAGPSYLEVVGLRRLSAEFGDVLDAANAKLPLPFKFNLTYDQPGHPLQYYCRADHYSYARYGIPSVAFSRGEHLDYHQVTDEAQYIDYDALSRVARFVHDAVRELANRSARPKLDKPKTDPRAPCVQ